MSCTNHAVKFDANCFTPGSTQIIPNCNPPRMSAAMKKIVQAQTPHSTRQPPPRIGILTVQNAMVPQVEGKWAQAYRLETTVGSATKQAGTRFS